MGTCSKAGRMNVGRKESNGKRRSFGNVEDGKEGWNITRREGGKENR